MREWMLMALVQARWEWAGLWLLLGLGFEGSWSGGRSCYILSCGFFSNLMHFTYAMDLHLYSVMSLGANTYIIDHSGQYQFHILTLCLFHSGMQVLLLLNLNGKLRDALQWLHNVTNCTHPEFRKPRNFIQRKYACGPSVVLGASLSSLDYSLHDFGWVTKTVPISTCTWGNLFLPCRFVVDLWLKN